ncbi:MAG TPA: formylglycine-generating enzyme family protein [Acidimicrobiia bacterium]
MPTNITDDMVAVPAGTFTMGSDDHYPEERPSHPVSVEAFAVDRHQVTNREFADFVAQTGHVTVAEVPPNPADYPGALPEMLYAGSLVFIQPPGPVDLRDIGNWWSFVEGADWRHPIGPDSDLTDLEDHPVVHVAYADAMAYAEWAGKVLPTEAEWERAAWGGLENAEFAWGDELMPDGQAMANFWQGDFPWQNDLVDGYLRTAPVESFPPNGFGLFDMIGNVWEWTTSWYSTSHPQAVAHACCAPVNPRGAEEEGSFDLSQPEIRIPRKVIKGGSHLCAPNYCRRYRPAARFPEPIDTSTSHLGFRCISRNG